MRSIPCLFVAVSLLLGGGAPNAWAQSFYGTGTSATEPLPLNPGLVVFQLEHSGDGPFTVQLANEAAGSVQTLVDATGAVSELKAVEIAEAGDYRFEVASTGEWSIRLRREAGTNATADSTVSADSSVVYQARADAAASGAGQGWPWGWSARGLLGGAVAGPIGAGVAYAFAGRSSVEPPDAGSALASDPNYQNAYRESFAERVRNRRREAALVGGLVGTGVFLYVLLQVIDLDGSGGGEPGPITTPF